MPRQKEFDPDEALEKAMRFFWQRGYRHTSIRDLIGSTGVNFYGLYNVFGDKRGIYLKGLDKYMSLYVSKIKAAAKDAGSFHEAIHGIFSVAYKIVTTENQNAGCMVCNAAVEVASIDEDIAKRVQNHRDVLQRFCLSLFETHKEELAHIHTDEYKARAEYVCSQIYSMGFLVRSKCSNALVKRHMETTIKLLT